nr:MAG TPA: hypothetical protein [Caudoviricetes sp.]
MKTYLATFESQDYEKLEVTFNVEKGQRFETRLHQVEDEYWGWYLINIVEVIEE